MVTQMPLVWDYPLTKGNVQYLLYFPISRYQTTLQIDLLPAKRLVRNELVGSTCVCVCVCDCNVISLEQCPTENRKITKQELIAIVREFPFTVLVDVDGDEGCKMEGKKCQAEMNPTPLQNTREYQIYRSVFFMYRTLTIAVHISTRTQNVWDYAIDGVKQNKYDATEPVSKFTLN